MNTVTILKKWADYNTEVNQDLAKIVAPLTVGADPRWEAPVGSFFKNLKGILNHLATADLMWLRRFAENGLATAELSPYLTGLPEAGYGKNLFDTWADYLTLRSKLDDAWKAFVKAVPENKLEENFTYTNFQGKSVTAPWIGLIFHLLNHQTHHRGAISQILDSWQIDNDYSGMTRVWML